MVWHKPYGTTIIFLISFYLSLDRQIAKPTIQLRNDTILNEAMRLLIKFKENCRFRIDCSKWETDVETITFCNICIKEIAAKILITCRHFKLQRVYKELNIFMCFSVKPSVAVTEESVENKNKRMFMEVLH